jgi:hypothetical protein
MRITFELLPGVVRADIRDRETPEETRALAEAVFAEREKHGVLGILMVARDSRPIFKVEDYGLSSILERIAAIPGLRVAVVAEGRELRAAHEYIELLARQRGVAYRAFPGEMAALAWLREPR